MHYTSHLIDRNYDLIEPLELSGFAPHFQYHKKATCLGYLSAV